MREVLDAMNANFVGYEPIQEMLKNAPCYGNNDPYADSIAKDVDRFTQVEAEKSSRDRGIHVDVRYVPITSHVPFGKIIAATPNGRVAGFPWLTVPLRRTAPTTTARPPFCCRTTIPKTTA